MMANVNSTDLKGNEGICPLCWQNNITSKLVPVFFKVREAIYTCENISCVYFITDDFGNVQRFTKSSGARYSNPASVTDNSNGCIAPNKVSESASTQPSGDNSTSSYFDEIFNCQSKDAAVESIINELSTDLKDLFENGC